MYGVGYLGVVTRVGVETTTNTNWEELDFLSWLKLTQNAHKDGWVRRVVVVEVEKLKKEKVKILF